MRLVEGVHLVASGSGGVDLSHPFDCNAYVLDGGGDAALVDAGIGAAPEALLAEAERAGVARGRIRLLLLTHAHPDHAGGAAALRELLPGLQVLASPQVADVVERGDEDAMSLEAGTRAGFYPEGYRFRPCPVDRRLADGERVRVGELELAALATPGHSAGHLAFLGAVRGRTVCCCGDLLFYGGRISLESNWDCDLRAYAASVERLAGAGVDVLLPGHHEFTLAGGQRHIDTAVRRFRDGFVPRSVV